MAANPVTGLFVVKRAPSPEDKDGLSGGVIAAIVIAVIAVVAVAVGVVWYCTKNRSEDVRVSPGV
jgi:hypothetical protein